MKISTFNYPFSTPIFEAEFQVSVASTLNGKSYAKCDHLTVEAVSKNFTLLAVMCSAAFAALCLNNSQSQSGAEHTAYSPSFDGGSVQLGGTC